MTDFNPYAAPKAQVDDIVTADARAEPATRRQRFFAAFIDALLFLGIGVMGGLAVTVRGYPVQIVVMGRIPA